MMIESPISNSFKSRVTEPSVISDSAALTFFNIRQQNKHKDVKNTIDFFINNHPFFSKFILPYSLILFNNCLIILKFFAFLEYKSIVFN